MKIVRIRRGRRSAFAGISIIWPLASQSEESGQSSSVPMEREIMWSEEEAQVFTDRGKSLLIHGVKGACLRDASSSLIQKSFIFLKINL